MTFKLEKLNINSENKDDDQIGMRQRRRNREARCQGFLFEKLRGTNTGTGNIANARLGRGTTLVADAKDHDEIHSKALTLDEDNYEYSNEEEEQFDKYNDTENK